MSKKDKLESKLRSRPKDFTWNELETLLKGHGYELFKGKGSRRKFIHETTKLLIILHEPHPDNVLKRYMIDQVVASLEELNSEK